MSDPRAELERILPLLEARLAVAAGWAEREGPPLDEEHAAVHVADEGRPPVVPLSGEQVSTERAQPSEHTAPGDARTAVIDGPGPEAIAPLDVAEAPPSTAGRGATAEVPGSLPPPPEQLDGTGSEAVAAEQPSTSSAVESPAPPAPAAPRRAVSTPTAPTTQQDEPPSAGDHPVERFAPLPTPEPAAPGGPLPGGTSTDSAAGPPPDLAGEDVGDLADAFVTTRPSQTAQAFNTLGGHLDEGAESFPKTSPLLERKDITRRRESFDKTEATPEQIQAARALLPDMDLGRLSSPANPGPFHDSDFEERLADVLERAALEAGVDLS